MKGAEFYEGGRIQVYIGLRERGEGGEKEGPGKFGLSLEEKETGSEKRRSEIWKGTKRKKGSHTVESTDTRETRSHLPTAPWPYVPYFSPLFNPGTISARIGEERFHEREIATWKGRVTVLLLRSNTKIEAKMEIFYFNWGKNLDCRGTLLNCIMEEMETCIFQRESFFFSETRLRYFKFVFDSAT